MPLINSKTGKLIKQWTPKELKESMNYWRGYMLTILCGAKSGHAGGNLSILDIEAVLNLNYAKLDPKNTDWDGRDFIIRSGGHKCVSGYMFQGFAGFHKPEDVATLRALDSPFQGHPHWLKLPVSEFSTGSLGQGLSIGVGVSIALKLQKKNNRVFVIMGDGEQDEGQVWEAAMSAAHHKCDNLTAFIDYNRLQIDGWIKDVMDVDPLRKKYEAFGWHVFDIDGHNIEEIIDALNKAGDVKDKPQLIIARTVKGKGVSFMENQAGWHGRVPNHEELIKALDELGVKNKVPHEKLLKIAKDYQEKMTNKVFSKMKPKFSKDYFWNKQDIMKVKMDKTRAGFGKVMEETGGDKRMVCLGCDISGSIQILDFLKNHPERIYRWKSIGIAEANATNITAGLAKLGFLPVVGSYGVFISGRNLDQIRTTICYGNFNVLIVIGHCGVSVGPDGATHQTLEYISNLSYLPNMHICVPCDYIETRKATKTLLFDVVGPKAIAFARESTPIITKEDTPFVFGKANICRFRGEKENFVDAFEIYLSSVYKNENEDLTIISNSPELAESLRAAWILKEEYGIESRVINMHTVKPLDKDAIIRAAKETKLVITAEEHQVGGFGNQIAGVIATAAELKGIETHMAMIGVEDRFGDSGEPWELMFVFKLSAEHIAEKAKKLIDTMKN